MLEDLIFVMIWVIVLFILILPTTLIFWVITPLTGIIIVLSILLGLLFIPNDDVNKEDTSSGK